MVIVGKGFTVIVNVLTGPGQPLAVAVTLIVAVTGELIAVNAGIFPVPDNPNPTFAVLVQANVAPATLEPNTTAAPFPFWQ